MVQAHAAGFAILGAAFGALAAVGLGNKAAPKQRRAGKDKEHKNVFVLVVTLTLKTAADRERVLELWRPLAEHVAAHEPGTLSYEAVRSDKNSTVLYFVERFRDKERDYLGAHRGSAAYQKFFEQLQQQVEVVAKDGFSGFESDFGFA